MIFFKRICFQSELICIDIFQVGNPETEDYYDYKGLLEYAWSHAVISDQLYNKAKEVCDFKQFEWSNDCNKAMSEVFKDYSEIDIYNIYAPSCHLNSTVASDSNSNSNSQESLTKVDYIIKLISQIYRFLSYDH